MNNPFEIGKTAAPFQTGQGQAPHPATPSLVEAPAGTPAADAPTGYVPAPVKVEQPFEQAAQVSSKASVKAPAAPAPEFVAPAVTLETLAAKIEQLHTIVSAHVANSSTTFALIHQEFTAIQAALKASGK